MRLFIFSVITIFLFEGCQESVNPLQNKNSTKISIFPNPASTYIDIDVNTNSSPGHLEIKILDGKNTDYVFSGSLSQTHSVIADVSKYKSQSILVQILIDNSMEERQVIIER